MLSSEKDPLKKMPISGKEIESLKLLDKNKSTLKTILLTLGELTAEFIVFDANCCSSFGSGLSYYTC